MTNPPLARPKRLTSLVLRLARRPMTQMSPSMALRRERLAWQGALVLPLLLACGGGGGGSAEDPAPFLGAWTLSSGAATPTCASAPIPVAPVKLDGTAVTVTKGSESPLVVAVALAPGQSCNLKYDLKGDTATARPGQTCMLSIMMIPALVSVTSATFVVQGETGTLHLTGKATALGSVVCDLTLTGTAAKGAPPPAP